MKLLRVLTAIIFSGIVCSAFAQDEYPAEVDSAWIASQNGGSTELNDGNNEEAPACIGDGCNGTETATTASTAPEQDTTAKAETVTAAKGKKAEDDSDEEDCTSMTTWAAYFRSFPNARTTSPPAGTTTMTTIPTTATPTKTPTSAVQAAKASPTDLRSVSGLAVASTPSSLAKERKTGDSDTRPRPELSHRQKSGFPNCPSPSGSSSATSATATRPTTTLNTTTTARRTKPSST